ncbi:diaminopimelate epimerase [Aquisphaera insulae]|uniref:diaminopimelate epimerase n=1 Tax=Aquisphaera insulae TaxID=2712864 RepID=UPI0013EB408E|nr:diaminopimelate epimerase [Aquisphaera insulae]
MKFTKMHGLGNDYVYVETFRQSAPSDPGALAVAVSDRHFGVGADGLILIMPSELADARMRMFNADGSEGEMCGNGVRCVAKFLYDHGLARKDQVTVETGRGVLVLDLEISGGKARRVRVDMAPPVLISAQIPTTLAGDPPIDVPIDLGGQSIPVTAVSMGNPHAVAFVDDVTTFPLELLGPRMENHPAFPRRVNAHVVDVVGRGEVRMRTWERGSGITLACGTGACAVCVAGVLTGRTDRRILAHLPGGDLELEWPADDASVFMTGPATEVFEGEWPSA